MKIDTNKVLVESFKSNADKVALVVGPKKITYSEFDYLARKWAQLLIRKKARRIGVYCNKSILSYVSMLAIRYIGGTYIPLNPDYNLKRTSLMIEQSELDGIITDTESLQSLSTILDKNKRDIAIILPESEIHDIKNSTGLNITTCNKCDDVLENIIEVNPGAEAYILFTSGSTGTPKGVPINYGNLNAFLDYNIKLYNFSEEDRFAQTFDHTFDLSFFSTLIPWLIGATVYSLSKFDLITANKYMYDNKITVWFSVPSAANLIFQRKSNNKILNKLKYTLFCGEPLTQTIIEYWAKMAPNSIIENLYGPTEATISCAHFRIDPHNPRKHNGYVSIGKLYDTLDYLIIDENGQEKKSGSGELCVGGDQVFRGYLKNISASQQAFHYSGDKEDKYYKTGDLVTTIDENLYFVGRKDHQIKLNGYRIELGEIEGIFNQKTIVSQVCALVISDENKNCRDLIVFISGNELDKKSLLEKCQIELPFYAQPKDIIILDQLPLNSNGKTDRNKLVSMVRGVSV